MTPEMWVALATLGNALASFLGASAAVSLQLKMLRHQINAAHRRLDKMGAPPADMQAIPD